MEHILFDFSEDLFHNNPNILRKAQGKSVVLFALTQCYAPKFSRQSIKKTGEAQPLLFSLI